MNKSMNGATELSTVVLALPKTESGELVEFYREFIRLLAGHIRQKILLLGGEREYEALQLEGDLYGQVEWRAEWGSMFDIWIRDYAPIISRKRDVSSTVNQIYYPAYYPRTELKKLGFTPFDPQEITLRLAELLPAFPATAVTNGSLILDGGNFVSNRRGEAIISTRIFADNPEWSRLAIEKELSRALGIDRILFIGCEPGDETGHVDGVVRFADDQTVIVGRLPDEYIRPKAGLKREDYEACRDYLNELADELSASFKVVRLTDLPPLNKCKEGIPSAYGNYVNFFQCENKLFVPQYHQPEADGQACEVLRNAFQDIQPVIVPVDCQVLSSYGGVLNCITWEF
ncbi:MAG: agmatine deiminase family protein [Tannerellaceae bacterium]|jgi:agmatine deiminase|nr:agmatine deiminase family protein [Tannerellaceae bacterium]